MTRALLPVDVQVTNLRRNTEAVIDFIGTIMVRENHGVTIITIYTGNYLFVVILNCTEAAFDLMWCYKLHFVV